MMKLILFCVLFITIKSDFLLADICDGSNATSQSVINYCLTNNGSLKSRCCFFENSTSVLSIDLTNMNLIKVPDLSQRINFLNLTMIDLRLNPQLIYSNENDFLGMKSLDYLLLPEQYSCPGDKYAWEIINQTNNPSGFACIHQKDICNNSSDMCGQTNSYCLSNGPNHFLCLCKTGYYGYKCLRHGEFPQAKFYGIVIVGTISLSVLLYYSHRKHVKKTQ